MPIKYTREEICKALEDVAKVTDLNKVKQSVVVKQIIPNYDEKMGNFKIGLFLKNVKYGKYDTYYDFLTNLGFKVETERLISRIVYICGAIDELVALGINLDEVPRDAMMSDYISSYKDKDLKIGQTLFNARYGRIGVTLQSKLNEHNFDFDLKFTKRRKDICKVLEDVAKVTNLNTISQNAIVRDIIPNYPGEMAEFKIGIFIQNARSGNSYSSYREFLEELGFTFENVRNRHSIEYICEAIDELVKRGVDLNKVPAKAMMSDYMDSYAEDDFCIGHIFTGARLGKVGEVIKTKLEENNFKFDRAEQKRKEIYTIVKKVAQVRDLNKISLKTKVKDILPNYQGDMSDWNIGDFLLMARTKKCHKEYEPLLLSLGFEYGVKQKLHNNNYKIKAINDLVNAGVDLNKILEREKISDYISSYSDDDYYIGRMLIQARSGNANEAVKDELKKHGFNFAHKAKKITVEEKLRVVKLLIDKGVDINSITESQTFGDYVELEDNQTNYRVGTWLRNANRGVGGEEFLQGLKDLGYKFQYKYKKSNFDVNNLI